jgi:Deacetylase PdaC/Protein of unknown function (DUF3298)
MKLLKKLGVTALAAILLFTPVFLPSHADAKVVWNGVEVTKGQIGIVTVLKDTQLYHLNGNKLVVAKSVKKGQKYRVYSISNQYGGLYAVGKNLYAKKSNSIKYEKVPSDKIQALGVNVSFKKVLNGIITYPQFSGLFNKKLERSINNHFLNLGKQAEADYWDLKQQEAEDMLYDWYIGPYEYSMHSSVSYNQDNLLSVSVIYYTYAGGAHGMSWIDTYNYDLLKAREVHLSDIITNKTQLNKVNTFIKNAMKYRNKKGAQFSIEEFHSVNLKEDQFYFTKDGIMIIFQEYQYGPYSNGISFFKVPYSVFK